MELLWLAARHRDLAMIAHIDEPSARAVEEAKRGGRGLVFAASHTGNWDLAACAIASHLPLMVITKRLSMPGIDAFWQGARARYGITLVGAAGAMARARAHLAAGGAVAMMIDQVPDTANHSVRAPFLGSEAHVDRAPFTLAAACRVPLLVAAARRTDHGQALRVLTSLTPPAAAATGWAQGAALDATAALDSFVRAHPSEWLWMHRRWRSPSDSRAARRPERP
jgi:KDO2-lipid IV(A) lauroyltransferase